MNERLKVEELLRRRLLICAGGSLAVASLPTILTQIRAVVPEARLRVTLTKNAAAMMPPTVLACLTDAPVLYEWPAQESGEPAHIALSDWADMILVLPATANLLAKAAHGIADDLVTTIILAADKPILFVPSMNERMWRNPIVQDNVARLRAFGRHVIDPSTGFQVATSSLSVGAIPPLRDLLRKILVIIAELELQS